VVLFWSALTCQRFQSGTKMVSLPANSFTCRQSYTSEMSPDWPHAPVHRLDSAGIYMVTAATRNKEHLFAGQGKLTLLEHCLLSLAKRYQCQLEAWAVFPNHYHFVARSNSDSANLSRLLKHLHAESARELNRADGKTGRTVWFNFWDTKLTYERSYLARLNYVHQNPVKHKLVFKANQYRWCSAAWFERVAAPAMVETIYSFKTDKLNVHDDF
jgi:putative transposase